MRYTATNRKGNRSQPLTSKEKNQVVTIEVPTLQFNNTVSVLMYDRQGTGFLLHSSSCSLQYTGKIDLL